MAFNLLCYFLERSSSPPLTDFPPGTFLPLVVSTPPAGGILQRPDVDFSVPVFPIEIFPPSLDPSLNSFPFFGINGAV